MPAPLQHHAVTAYQVSTLAGRSDTVWHASNYGQRRPLPIPVWRSGFRDGHSRSALFNKPTGLAVDRRGRLYVADSLNHCIRRIAPNGRVSTLAGNGERGHHDGLGRKARFNHPTGLALAPGGELYVVDQGNRALRCILPHGKVLSIELPGRPLGGIALDAQGLVYLVLELKPQQRPLAVLGRFNPQSGEWQLLTDWENELQWLSYRRGEEQQPFSRWWLRRQQRPQPFEIAEASLAEGLGLAMEGPNTLIWLTGLHLYRLEQLGPEASRLALQRQALKFEIWPGARWQGLSVDAEGVIHVLDARHHSLYRIRPGQDPEQVMAAGLDGLDNPYSVITDGYGQLYVSDTGHWRICRLIPPGRESLLQLARLAFLPYLPTAHLAEKGIFEVVKRGLKSKAISTVEHLPAPTVAVEHVLDVLQQGNRSQQLACTKELLDQLQQPGPRYLNALAAVLETLLTHPEISVRTLVIRHICDTVQHERDALFWIELLEKQREPNRLLKKYLIEVLAFLGKRYQLYGHVVPLMVDYIQAAEEDVVEYVFGHLMAIRKAGYESLVDPLIEELSRKPDDRRML